MSILTPKENPGNSKELLEELEELEENIKSLKDVNLHLNSRLDKMTEQRDKIHSVLKHVATGKIGSGLAISWIKQILGIKN